VILAVANGNKLILTVNLRSRRGVGIGHTCRISFGVGHQRFAWLYVWRKWAC